MCLMGDNFWWQVNDIIEDSSTYVNAKDFIRLIRIIGFNPTHIQLSSPRLGT